MQMSPFKTERAREKERERVIIHKESKKEREGALQEELKYAPPNEAAHTKLQEHSHFPLPLDKSARMSCEIKRFPNL